MHGPPDSESPAPASGKAGNGADQRVCLGGHPDLPTQLAELRRTDDRLFRMRASMLDVLPTSEGCDYRRSLFGGAEYDFATIEAECGVVVVTSARFLVDRTFDLAKADDHGAVLSAVIEAFGPDRQTVEDLIAWPIGRPAAFATAMRCADVIGGWRIEAAPIADRPLRVFRHPEAWLRAGCAGIVVVDPILGSRQLAQTRGTIAAEDIAHGREIAAWLPSHFDRRRVLAPIPRVAAA